MEPVRFTTEDGVSLEGELRVDVPEPVGSAAICHPHPQHGGSKDHPILWAIRNDLAIEAAYIGSANGLYALGLQDSAVLMSNGVEGDFRLNLTTADLQRWIDAKKRIYGF